MSKLLAFSASCLAAFCMLSASAVQAAQPLKFIAEKSTIEFLGKKTDGQHKGGFKSFEAEATADFENPSNGEMKITIQTDSLWSDDEKLTGHLKNPDFFDVRKHPKIIFTSTKTEADETQAKLVGKLNMLGKDGELEVPCKVEVNGQDVKVTAEFKLDRTKWGMNYGVGKIEKEVAITAVLVFSLH
jgi:polyisoprenoid-binding protein YceI